MKQYRWSVLAGAALMSQVGSAQALDFNWSWIANTDNLGGGAFGAGTVVSGTISGLLDNTANQNAVTIVVDNPVGPVSGFVFSGGAGFSVFGGVVTGSDARYVSGDYVLYFADGTNFNPEFLNRNLGESSFDIGLCCEGQRTSFTSAVPEPTGLGALAVGLTGLAIARRRRRRDAN